MPPTGFVTSSPTVSQYTCHVMEWLPLKADDVADLDDPDVDHLSKSRSMKEHQILSDDLIVVVKKHNQNDGVWNEKTGQCTIGLVFDERVAMKQRALVRRRPNPLWGHGLGS